MRIRAVTLAIVPAFAASAAAHGGDPSVLHACINAAGIIRAVTPNEECPSAEAVYAMLKHRQPYNPSRLLVAPATIGS